MSGSSVRPTADRVKEALFSMLLSRVSLEGTVWLDLFAGSGALGIEALSRGAAAVTFVEEERSARAVLERNVARCGFADRATIVPLRVQRALRDFAARPKRFDGALLDPPYARGLAVETLQMLGSGEVLVDGALVTAEHHVDDVLAETYGTLQLTASKRYGSTALTVYREARSGERTTTP